MQLSHCSQDVYPLPSPSTQAQLEALSATRVSLIARVHAIDEAIRLVEEPAPHAMKEAGALHDRRDGE
jgi:hypothetical protein